MRFFDTHEKHLAVNLWSQFLLKIFANVNIFWSSFYDVVIMRVVHALIVVKKKLVLSNTNFEAKGGKNEEINSEVIYNATVLFCNAP